MIKNIDLETLYSKINNRINLIGSHAGDPDLLPKIMRSCRLKPYSLFSTGFQSRFVFEPHWVDEFGNSFKIDSENIKIIVNDTQITKNTQISTDLFFGNAISTIANNSKCVMVATGDRSYITAFYGKDEYLRVFFFHEKIAQISPLLLGISSLKEYFKHITSATRPVINKDRLDLLLKFDVINCNICWQPADWQNYIKEI